MATPSVQPERQIPNIPTSVRIPRPEEVRSYLEQYPDLAALVPTICGFTREEFGNELEMALEVYHDPEVDDHYLTLKVVFEVFKPNLFNSIDSVWQKVEKDKNVDMCDIPGWMIIFPLFQKAQVNHAV